MLSPNDYTLQDRFEVVRGNLPIDVLAKLCHVAQFRLREWLALPSGGSKKAIINIEAWVAHMEFILPMIYSL